MKAFSSCSAEECFLLTAIGDMLAVVDDLTNGVHLVFLVLGCSLLVLIFTRPVLDLGLRLALDKSRFIFA